MIMAPEQDKRRRKRCAQLAERGTALILPILWAEKKIDVKPHCLVVMGLFSIFDSYYKFPLPSWFYHDFTKLNKITIALHHIL